MKKKQNKIRSKTGHVFENTETLQNHKILDLILIIVTSVRAYFRIIARR